MNGIEDMKLFPIGTKYLKRGKVKRQWVIVDTLKTYNSYGELHKVRYICETVFLGQKLRDSDVVHTTIARGLDNV